MREEFYKTLSSPLWWGVLVVAALLPLVLSSYYLHILTLSLEPERLVAKVRSMLNERPQGRVMVFPEEGRMRGSDLARTS